MWHSGKRISLVFGECLSGVMSNPIQRFSEQETLRSLLFTGQRKESSVIYIARIYI